MSNNTKSTVIYGGIGFFEALGLILIVLKLCKVIDISWWLVLLPIYGPIVLYIIGLVVTLIVAVVISLIQGLVARHKAKKLKKWRASLYEDSLGGKK